MPGFLCPLKEAWPPLQEDNGAQIERGLPEGKEQGGPEGAFLTLVGGRAEPSLLGSRAHLTEA